jgi:hypothetical protein
MMRQFPPSRIVCLTECSQGTFDGRRRYATEEVICRRPVREGAFALFAFASAIPYRIALFDKSEFNLSDVRG